ncbi:MAG TPA: potassium/proton antiporter [Solirubrobacterales bacterium]|nr:potassium/proton antiporter [Solirubrobacterales bacterium]
MLAAIEGHDAELILLAGSLLAAGIGAALIADRVRVPGLLLFLGLGMLLGSDGLGGIEFDDVELARALGTVGLVLILFEGGLTAGWREIRPVLGTAMSLALVGTVVTAAISGLAAKWIFGFDTLDALIIGAAVAATDSAAIFAVLRGSNLERPLARSLEGESGMNDPVALLLVLGFIHWIEEPGYGAADMLLLFAGKLAIGVALGLLLGRAAQAAFCRLTLPTSGIYPVASLAVAGITYGLTEVAGGSGLLAVYLTALALGRSDLPGRRTIVAFHQGLGWIAQISLFLMLGLLVFPSHLDEIAAKGLLLSAVLILVARPVAAVLASLPAPFDLRERLMLGWAGLRGATPIWLATFPVAAGVGAGGQIFDIVFFVVVTSTLVQGATFEPLARRLRLTTDEPAIPQRLLESGRIRALGGEIVVHGVEPGAAAAGHPVRELGLPREALVNVIVREGQAIPPRGSTTIEEGDELHIVLRGGVREEVEGMARRWREGPIGEPRVPSLPPRGAPQIFSVRPARAGEDASPPTEVNGIAVATPLRIRRDRPGALVQLIDGRHAVTGGGLTALGGRRTLAAWCEDRARRSDDGGERAWLQELAGALRAAG